MTCATDLEIPSSEPDEQQTIVDRFHELLSSDADPGFTLTNIYKEMPITHAASSCELKGHHLEICTCDLQLAAISQCKEVYIRSSQLEAPVLGRLESIDIRRGMVHLHEFSYVELKEVNRKTVRVRFKKTTPHHVEFGR